MKKKNAFSEVNKVKNTVKTVTALVAGWGATELVSSILKDFRPDAQGIRRVAIKIGAIAVTGMVVKHVTDFINEEIDDIFDEAMTEATKEKEEIRV